VDKVVKLLEQVIAVQEKVVAEDHPSRLASQHALAMAYDADGQVAKAVELLKYVVSVKARIFRVCHPSRVVSESSLATMYKELRSDVRDSA
jgi:Tetratricopeptide repeat